MYWVNLANYYAEGFGPDPADSFINLDKYKRIEATETGSRIFDMSEAYIDSTASFASLRTQLVLNVAWITITPFGTEYLVIINLDQVQNITAVDPATNANARYIFADGSYIDSVGTYADAKTGLTVFNGGSDGLGNDL